MNTLSLINGKVIFILVFLAITLLSSKVVWSADIFVDQTYGHDLNSGLDWGNAKQTISGGLSLSSTLAGPDTVHVAEGNYTGGITLVQFTALLGGYPAGGGLRNPSLHQTKIIGGGSVVTGADDATIDGFTISYGVGTQVTSPYIFAYGGGILCEGTSPTISNNIIQNNNVNGGFATPDAGSAYGGGIYCMYSAAIIVDNIIEGNQAFGSAAGYTCGRGIGGGIYCENSSCTISGNLIRDNNAHGGSPAGYYASGCDAMGAGICCINSYCTISENLIYNNITDAGTAHYGPGNAMGSGIYVVAGRTQISRNKIESNHVKVYEYGGPIGGALGGGIYADSLDTVIENNLIGFNRSDEWGFPEVAGIYTNGNVMNNTIYNNTGSGCGGVWPFDGALIINNIFVNNEPFAMKIGSSSPPAAVWNNNFFNSATGILEYSSTTYTDVATMETDLSFCIDNIECAPNFVGPDDYHLSRGSCCIDTGTSFLAPSNDYYGDPRPYGAGYDIGGDEFNGTFVPVLDTKSSILIMIIILGLPAFGLAKMMTQS